MAPENDEEVESEVFRQPVVQGKRVYIQVKKSDFENRELLVGKDFANDQEPIPEYVKRQLEEQGWETLFTLPQSISKKVVKEIYAVVHPHRGDSARVRGKLVKLSPKTIDAHLSLLNEVGA